MKAYGTTKPDPCDDDYNLKVVTYPTVPGQGLINENWDTEHVMDAQIIQQFFDYLNANLPTSSMPATWWSRDSQTNKIGHFQVQRASRYMRDFWEDRRGSGGLTATDYLLEVYPGTHQYTGELTLLGHGINRKKESIFDHRGGSCIGSSTWRAQDYWGKVDKLRECVLLAHVRVTNLRIALLTDSSSIWKTPASAPASVRLPGVLNLVSRVWNNEVVSW